MHLHRCERMKHILIIKNASPPTPEDNKDDPMSDEQLYLQATEEVENNKTDSAIWAKALTLMQGDKEQAKYEYIKLRVEQLSPKEKKSSTKTSSKTPSKPLAQNDHLVNYIPIAEFSEIKGIGEAKIVKMIREGFYQGKLVNHRWYVHISETKDLHNTKGPEKTRDINPLLNYVSTEDYAAYKNITEEKAVEMVREGSIQGKQFNSKWYISRDELGDTEYSHEPDKKILAKIIDGDYGLATTFWGFNFLGGLVFGFLIFIAFSSRLSGLFVVTVILGGIYNVITMIGIWNAANYYEGDTIWPILAKILVVIGAINLVYSLFQLPV